MKDPLLKITIGPKHPIAEAMEESSLSQSDLETWLSGRIAEKMEENLRQQAEEIINGKSDKVPTGLIASTDTLSKNER